jgi:hypothetical protein
MEILYTHFLIESTALGVKVVMAVLREECCCEPNIGHINM